MVRRGEVLRGFGLHNAGWHYTVLAIAKKVGKVKLEEHLTGRVFWDSPRWYLHSNGDMVVPD